MPEDCEKFKDLFNNLANGILIATPVHNGHDFIIKDINPAAEKIDNIKKEDVVGRLITDAFPSIKDFTLLSTMQKVHETGEPQHHPISYYADSRIAGWRENFVYRAFDGDIINVYYDRTEEMVADKKFRENLLKNEAIIKALPDLFFRFNEDGVYLDCWTNNPKLLISDPEYFIGKRVDEVLPKDIADRAIELIKNVLKNKEAETLQYDLIVEGERKFFESRLVYDTEKTVLAIVRNITEREEMIIRIKENEERFNKIFRTSPDAILITSFPDGVIVDMNAAAEVLSGYKLDEIRGKKTSEIGFWENPNDRDAYVKLVMSEGQVTNYESKFKVKIGVIDTLISGEILEISGKKYFVSIVRNISELRRINRALNISEQKFRDIAENVSEIVIEMDKNCDITFVNNGAVHVIGYTPDELIGNKFVNYLTGESSSKCQKIHRKMVDGKDTSICNCVADFITKSGKTKILSIQWRIAFFNGEGNKTYMVARDITEEETRNRLEADKVEKVKEQVRESLFAIENKVAKLKSRRTE